MLTMFLLARFLESTGVPNGFGEPMQILQIGPSLFKGHVLGPCSLLHSFKSFTKSVTRTKKKDPSSLSFTNFSSLESLSFPTKLIFKKRKAPSKALVEPVWSRWESLGQQWIPFLVQRGLSSNLVIKKHCLVSNALW